MMCEVYQLLKYLKSSWKKLVKSQRKKMGASITSMIDVQSNLCYVLHICNFKCYFCKFFDLPISLTQQIDKIFIVQIYAGNSLRSMYYI